MTSLHADEAYLGHYQFSHDPFAARVPGFRFFPAQRKPVLGQLHHLARYSQLLLVVTGPLGSGKTLLRQALVASTNKQAVHSVVVSARGAGDVAGVLRQVAQGLGIQQLDVRSILAHIAQLALTGQEVYLLVDDAELLADAAIEGLLALAAGTADARPHVFLFAEPELVSRLEVLADGEERFHAIELLPYSEDETREYLAQRLDGAGQGIELLSDDQVSDIHIGSGGWPGGINQVARDVLIEAMLAQRNAASAASGALGLPKKHVLAVAVVVLGLGAAWFMQGRQERLAEDAPVQLLPGAPAPEVAIENATPAPVVAKPEGGAAVEFAGASQPLPLPLVGEAQPVIREPLAQASGMDEGEEGGEAESLTALPSAQPVVQAAPVAAPVAVAPAVPVAPVQPVATVAKPVQAAPGPAAVVAPKPVAVVKPVAAKPAPAVAAKAGSASSGWYGAQPASQYALQILGTRSEAGAQAFVSKNGAEYRYFKKMHQGQPLYVVTYGKFSSRAAAQAAIKSLPASVQAGKPWPRSFASIQQEAVQAR